MGILNIKVSNNILIQSKSGNTEGLKVEIYEKGEFTKKVLLEFNVSKEQFDFDAGFMLSDLITVIAERCAGGIDISYIDDLYLDCIYANKIIDGITVDEAYIMSINNLYIRGIGVNPRLIINSLGILDNSIKNISLFNISIYRSFISVYCDSLEFHMTDLPEVHISRDPNEIEKKGNLTFSECKIGNVSIGNLLNIDTDIFNSIGFNNCTIDGQINLENTSFEGENSILEFDTCKFINDGNLNIIKSTLKNLVFKKTINRRISLIEVSLEHTFVYKSNIDNLNSIGIIGKGLENLSKEYGFLSINNPEIKELYRQLKLSHDSIGNKTEANKFYEKEMEYYRKSLWEERPRKWQKIIISYLNDIISDYGLNWWRALKFYFFFCSFVYIAHDFIRIHNLNVYDFLSGVSEFWKNNWTNIIRLNWSNSEFNDFARFLNPLPDLKEDKTILGLIFSTLKILIVYQIVVALRRISQR